MKKQIHKNQKKLALYAVCALMLSCSNAAAADRLMPRDSHTGSPGYTAPDISDVKNVTASSVTQNVSAVAVASSDNAAKDEKVNSVTATADADYQLDHDETASYDREKLQSLNNAIDKATDDYTALIDKYDEHINDQSYLAKIKAARAAVDDAINNYNALATQISAAGISADNGAKNTIHVTGTASANSGLYMDPYYASPVLQTALFQNSTKGIFADNNSENNVTLDSGLSVEANGISRTILDGTGKIQHQTNVTDIRAVASDNKSSNTVKTPYSIELSAEASNYEFGSQGESQSEKVISGNILHASAVSADNAAQNTITAGSINAVANTSSAAAASGEMSLNGKTDLHYFSADNVNAAEAKNSASNDITADSITVSNTFSGEEYGDTASINDSSESGDDYSLLFDQNINIRGISADNGSNHAQISGDISVRNNSESSVNENVGAALGNFSNTAYINANTAGIYGEHHANNDIAAANIAVNYDAPISIASYYNTGSAAGGNSIFNFSSDTNGIYGGSGAQNHVTAGNISASVENLYFAPGTEALANVKYAFNAPVDVQGVYGSDYAYNEVSADSVAAKADAFNISAPISDESYKIPVAVSAVRAQNNAVNIIKADSLAASIDNMQFHPSASLDQNSSMTFTAAGAYADTKAVNDITARQITAGSDIMPQNMEEESSYHIDSPVNVYGIYGAGSSVTNLRSKDEAGTVNITVGAFKNADALSDSGYYLDPNVHAYGIYLDNAAVNLYDNVKVNKIAAEDNYISAADPVTYFKDASINFTGYQGSYKDLRDPYAFDSAGSNYEQNLHGSGTFHTYTSDTGVLNLQGSDTFTVNADLASGKSDKMIFAKLDDTSSGSHYISVASDPSIKLDATGTIYGKASVINIADTSNKLSTGAGHFTFDSPSLSQNISSVSFTGKTFFKEDALRKYYITPTVQTQTDTNGNKNVVITRIDYNTMRPSNTVHTAGSAQTAARGIGLLGAAQDGALMQRMNDLRQDRHADGLWTKFSRGRLHTDGAYGSGVKQNYTQTTLGYDKEKDFSKSKVYTGGALSYVSGSSSYEYGSGNIKNTVLSLYSMHIADDGHYLDLVAKAERLKNNYNAYTSNGKRVDADYMTPGYQLSAEYGYRKKVQKGLFIQPQVQLSVGRMEGKTYHMTDGTKIDQSAVNSVIGRTGILVGRQYDNGSDIYLSASVYHDFGGAGSITGYSGQDSKKVSGEDYGTWYDIGLGGSIKMSKNSNMYMDISKSFGGNVHKDYQVNLGMCWSF